MIRLKTAFFDISLSINLDVGTAGRLFLVDRC